jgi:hypothetical protein
VGVCVNADPTFRPRRHMRGIAIRRAQRDTHGDPATTGGPIQQCHLVTRANLPDHVGGGDLRRPAQLPTVDDLATLCGRGRTRGEET